LEVDGAGRIPIVLMVLACFLLGSRIGKVSLKKPLTLYILFAFYILINGFLHASYLNYEGNGAYILTVNLLAPVLYLLLVSCLAYYDFDKTLKWVTWSLLAYCILCIVFGNMTDDGRLGGELNANGIATYADFAFYCLLIQFMRNKRSMISLLLFSVVPIILIVLTGSRTGFLLLVVVAVLSALLFYKKGHAESIIIVVFIAVFLIVGFTYVMNNTVLGERLHDSTTQIEGNIYETGTFIDKFGDRGPQYYWSWPYFLEHPIFGIGLMNWRKVSGMLYVFHSEWLVQYVENGLVALAIYLIFYFSLLRGATSVLNKLQGSEKKVMRVLIYSLISVFLLNFVSWTYNCYCVFAFYAFVYSFTKQKKNIMRSCIKMDKKRLYRNKYINN
jgi:O-antigen ligase